MMRMMRFPSEMSSSTIWTTDVVGLPLPLLDPCPMKVSYGYETGVNNTITQG